MHINSDGMMQIPAKKVKVIDTTGTENCFPGSFSYFPGAGSPMEEAIKNACHVTSLSVNIPGTQTSYPDRND